MKIEMIQLSKKPGQVKEKKFTTGSPSEAFEISEKDHQLFNSMSPGQLEYNEQSTIVVRGEGGYQQFQR
jgi:hypothetical protein